ncbi:MAG: type VI secretion system baseplate subunit TssG [Pirellulales bacterium]
MGSESRRENAPLNERLGNYSGDFDFFQAVRLMIRMAECGVLPGEERVAATDTSKRIRRKPPGHDFAPSEEVVRFRAVASHAFPATEIVRIAKPRAAATPPEAATDIRATRTRSADPPLDMFVAFAGLFGPSGVLPQHYTSHIIERIKDKDYALADFLDLFNHRVASLFYRAWEKYRFPIGFERFRLAPQHDERDDPFTACLYSLVGFGTEGLRDRQQFDDETLLYYGGHFAHDPRNAISLEAIVADYFSLHVEVRQFQGQWLMLATYDQSALPNAMQPRGLNCELGTNVIAGERVWDVQSKFRHRVGPVGYREFCRLMPSGDMLRPLCQLTRTYVGPQFDFDVQPVLRAEEVPWCRLGGDDEAPARLGWNTWIRSGEMPADAEDVIFRLEDV